MYGLQQSYFKLFFSLNKTKKKYKDLKYTKDFLFEKLL